MDYMYVTNGFNVDVRKEHDGRHRIFVRQLDSDVRVFFATVEEAQQYGERYYHLYKIGEV